LRTPEGTDKGFKKESFTLLNGDGKTIIHYIGDEALSEPAPHGNSKQQSKLFFRTKPSVLTTLCEKTQSALPPNRIYKEAVSEVPLNAVTDVPRNLKQIQNLKEKSKQDSRISRDSINNLHEMAYNFPGFIHQIFTYPDLVVVAGLQEMLDTLGQCLSSKCKHQLLSYDTTFSLGEFYVSPLLFRHVAFNEEPVMMVAVLVHERKLQLHHEAFFKTILKSLKNTRNVPIATDEEPALVNAIRQTNLFRVGCHRHLRDDVDRWVDGHEGKKVDRISYVDEVVQLLECETSDKAKQVRWSELCCGCA
jgi:hypothetical protein